MTHFKSGSLAVLAGAALSAAPRIAHACAMCGLSPGDHGIHAFNTSVLFMLSAPYLITAGIGAILYVAYRSALRKRRAGRPALHTAPSLGASIAKRLRDDLSHSAYQVRDYRKGRENRDEFSGYARRP